MPFYWWIATIALVVVLSYQLGMHRPLWWTIAGAVIFGALALWGLVGLSSRRVIVTQESDGTRWLLAGDAKLPADVVSRTIVVPASAKSAAMGRQLDPEAFVLSRAFVPEMAMLVLDDPDDPTPYWLISSRDPESLLKALGRPIA